ncbi:hypothetical protein CPLU01_03334 [Colletotrichum plurivorum]|uniref:Uncharacterized protein n=1 Tax=Colletotrichum plurivorum TaxID=2175906 RepID=A0A8H6KTH9_9PEZI|nr:hypothetical protein CPLU01_03334 [Colletotrichum plurivorum]
MIKFDRENLLAWQPQGSSQLWHKIFHPSRQHLKCFVPNAMRRYSRYFLPTRQYFHGDKAPSVLVLPLHPSSSLQVCKVAAQPNLEPRHPSEVLGEGSTSHKRPPPLDRTSTVPPPAHAEDA